MKIDDIKDGAIITIRDGRILRVEQIKDSLFAKDSPYGIIFSLANINSDLRHINDNAYDIMSVEIKTTWKREENVEMTIPEIEEKLGIKNLKIKK